MRTRQNSFLLGYIRSYDVAGQHTIAVRPLLISSMCGTEWRTGRVEANKIEVPPDLEPQCIQERADLSFGIFKRDSFTQIGQI